MIPTQLTLREIQECFRDIYAKILPLEKGNIQLNGRRITGAGKSVSPFDYVTQYELLAALSGVAPVQTTSLKDSTTALDPGGVVAASSLTNHAVILGSGVNKVHPLASLGTTTTVLHGNASADPSFGYVALGTDVSGLLDLDHGGDNGDSAFGEGWNPVTCIYAYSELKRLVDVVGLTGQAADIAATNLCDTNKPGIYLVHYYLENTVADAAAGAVRATFAFTDGVGATTVVGTIVNLTGGGTQRTSSVFAVHVASGNITYTTTHTGSYGTAQYALYITVDRLS